MKRRSFLTTMVASTGAVALESSLRTMADELVEQDFMMPAYFIGHGSPMNALEDNVFTRGWREAMANIPQPKAIICVSAHWLTKGTWITAMPKPRTIHDFGGFPRKLSEATYPAPGAPEMAQAISESITDVAIGLDQKWGLDHGAWSILMPVFPDADIPVMELSIDYDRPASWHYDLGRMLVSLRKRGVLVIGSGNIVHNLRVLNPQQPESGFDWADAINDKLKTLLLNQDHQSLINYTKLGKEIALAVPSPDHYYPLLYTLGLQTASDHISIFNDRTVMGSIAMTSVKLDSSLG